MASKNAGTPVSIEMIRTLIGLPTVSRDSNLELIHYARDYLKNLGAEFRLTYDDDRRKANLFATLGPIGEPGIVLSGHTDVVPVEGQDWDTDPFQLTEKDGRLYGRGTADMVRAARIAGIPVEIIQSVVHDSVVVDGRS